MVKIREPETLIKVATSYEDLEKIVKKFNPNVISVKSILGNTVQYHLYEEKPEHCMIILSQQVKKEVAPGDSNIQLTITSESEDLNKKVYEELSQRTGLEFREAPEFLQKIMPGLNAIFPVFKKHGKEAVITFLRGL